MWITSTDRKVSINLNQVAQLSILEPSDVVDKNHQVVAQFPSGKWFVIKTFNEMADATNLVKCILEAAFNGDDEFGI